MSVGKKLFSEKHQLKIASRLATKHWRSRSYEHKCPVGRYFGQGRRR
jgi:hypothetical protein